MSVRSVTAGPFDDQRPGTSGLRKSTRQFQTAHYLATFIQAVFDTCPIDGEIVLGGDGRFFSEPAAQEILRIAAANGAKRAVVGQGGLLSTPAVSHLIRSRSAWGGIVLSASHNPGGPDGDFGVKINGPNGAPAPEDVTEAIFARTRQIAAYRIFDGPRLDLTQLGTHELGPLAVEVVDPAADYADLMERLFDFDRIAQFLRAPEGGLLFDAMHAVTGPYATEIFCRRLGAPERAILRGAPLPDFGGGHPDPSLANAQALATRMNAGDAPAVGAASDGDGDRHLVMGPSFPVSASDSLAILLANAEHVPGYRGRIAGVARSMPTSRAVDAVAEALGLACYETPTGWKYFGALLDSGRITLCGEESAGAGSDHVREKDGLWAVLYWLNILAARGLSVEEVVTRHWARFGRVATQRLDWEGLPSDRAAEAIASLRRQLASLGGTTVANRVIERADDFAYDDPVTGARSERQGVRLFLSDGGRVVLRLSGTGTQGATLRVYLDQLNAPPSQPASVTTMDLEHVAQAVLVGVDPDLLAQSTTQHRT
ncbi:alpha-D-glucose phosphate-specific phosphoglucomutase [Phenylobacterium sp.]|uniref:alpha-D-glucose phosphate-specific phosphoglucomutase n=1 Tax=Phenylobacterium sp. TaxID=1871053 RepID=UPI0026385E20|nr:alpha-D-glucose phosphate-specific phosphoglucomutase [Phenylobacterium sp.]